MFTYTQLYKRSADDCGIILDTGSQAVINIQQDINQGLRLFKNASRRYWTRKEVKTNIIQNQQFYTFPQDAVRLTTARVLSGSIQIPIIMVDSEETWNRINLVPSMTIGTPFFGFIRGRNELGLYPVPSQNIANGLIMSYEPRLRDMTIDDKTDITVDVTGNNATVTTSGGGFNQNMVGMYFALTDGTDGNWYPITGFTDANHITLENVYQGPSVSGKACIIGQVPDIPEDYHLGLVYFACFNYFLKRKDKDTAAAYKSLFDDLYKQYKKVYANKTTGAVQDDILPYNYNLFGLPPTNVSA